MTDQEYEELNELMLNLVAYSEKYEPFLYDNISYLLDLSKMFYSKIGLHLYPAEGTFSHVPIEKSIELAKEVLSYINPEYVKSFEQDLEEGLISFYPPSAKKGNYCFADLEDKKVKIVVTLEENFSDGEKIIHEYMHKLNYLKDNETRHLLTEFISIFFEFFYHNILYAKGMPISEIQLCQKWRHDVVTDNVNCFLFEGMIFEKVKNSKKINQHIAQEFNVDLKKFEKDCNIALENAKEYKMETLDCYRYIYGTLLASYLYQNSKNIQETLKKLVYINSNINQMRMNEVLDYLNFPKQNFMESIVEAYKNKREDDLYMAEEQYNL